MTIILRHECIELNASVPLRSAIMQMASTCGNIMYSRVQVSLTAGTEQSRDTSVVEDVMTW